MPPLYREVNMLIEFVRDGKRATIPDKVAQELILRGLARSLEVGEEAISERTGKPKRRYQRRDMTAEQ